MDTSWIAGSATSCDHPSCIMHRWTLSTWPLCYKPYCTNAAPVWQWDDTNFSLPSSMDLKAPSDSILRCFIQKPPWTPSPDIKGVARVPNFLFVSFPSPSQSKCIPSLSPSASSSRLLQYAPHQASRRARLRALTLVRQWTKLALPWVTTATTEVCTATIHNPVLQPPLSV